MAFARAFNDEAGRAARSRIIPGDWRHSHICRRRRSAAAAAELERTVCDLGFKGALISGTIMGAFLDDARFAPLLASRRGAGGSAVRAPRDAARGSTTNLLRFQYPPRISFGLATFAWGWHYETALHIMRLAVSGALNHRHPNLQLEKIIGHMGEGLPAMLARCEHQLSTEASPTSAGHWRR